MNYWASRSSIVLLLILAACGRGVDPATAVAESQSLIAEGKAAEARIHLKQALAKQPNLPGAREMLARIALYDGDANAASDELRALAITNPADATPELAELQIETAIASGDTAKAAQWLEGSATGIQEPARSRLRARLMIAEGNPGEALGVLRAARQSHPDDDLLALETAAALAAMGNLSVAIAELDRYTADESRPRASALRVRGEIMLRQGQPTRAITDLKAALAAAPADWRMAERKAAEISLANAMLAVPDLESARKQVAHIEANWPGLLGTRVLQGRLALLDKRYKEAVDGLSQLSDAIPDNIQVKYLLADALIRNEEFTRATQVLEQLVAREAGPTQARRTLAELLMQQGRPDRVLELLGQEGDLPVTEASNRDIVSAARVARSRAGEQIATLTEQLKAKPGDPQLLGALAAAQVANGEPAAALATLGAPQARGWVPDAAAARISALLTTNNEIEANRVVDMLLATDSGASVETLVAAGDAARRHYRRTMASRLLDRAVTLDPENSDIKLRLASLAFDAKQYAPAEELLQEVLKKEPDSLVARLALARVIEAKGDVDASRDALHAAMKQAPQAAEPKLMLAGLELRANRNAEAIEVIDTMIEAHPDGAAAYAAAKLLAESRLLDEARTRFRRAVEQDGDNAIYWSSLAQIQLTLDDKPAALESLLKTAQLQPAALPVATAAVRLALEQGDVATARRVAAGTVAAIPRSAGAWILQGGAALSAGDAAAARDAYAKATALFPSSGAAIGEFQASVRLKSSRAAVPLAQWLAREPGDVNARRMLADYYISVGDNRSALTHLDIILRHAPNDAVTLNNLAWLLRQSDPERAERLASQAYAIAPDSGALADTLGMIYLLQGKHEEAVAVLAKAAQALPNDRAVQYHYGMALHRAGQRPAARDALQRALAGDADFEGRAEARKLLESL